MKKDSEFEQLTKGMVDDCWGDMELTIQKRIKGVRVLVYLCGLLLLLTLGFFIYGWVAPDSFKAVVLGIPSL